MSVFGTLHNPHTTPPALKQVGMPVAFPTGAQHVNFLGRYSFALAEPIACGAQHPLRNPHDPNEYEGGNMLSVNFCSIATQTPSIAKAPSKEGAWFWGKLHSFAGVCNNVRDLIFGG